ARTGPHASGPAARGFDGRPGSGEDREGNRTLRRRLDRRGDAAGVSQEAAALSADVPSLSPAVLGTDAVFERQGRRVRLPRLRGLERTDSRIGQGAVARRHVVGGGAGRPARELASAESGPGYLPVVPPLPLLMSRRVLIVSPHFPPDSSAGTHRARLLAAH